MTSSHAKQNFGDLLDAAASGPVAIERHKKIKAIVCSPDIFCTRDDHNGLLAKRRAARAAQTVIEQDRLIKHQRWAIELLLMPAQEQEKAIEQARSEVQRWRSAGVSSRDYIDRWEDLLKRSVPELARAMASDTLEWGPALRQNSPWHTVFAR